MKKEKISQTEVEHIAHLARIKLFDQEKKKFSSELSSILDYVEKLNELDTEKIRPTSHVIGLSNVMRQDKAKKFEQPEMLIEAAPEKKDGFVKVKSVLG